MGEFFLSSKEPSYIVMSEDSGRPYYVGRRPRVVELLVPMCCTKCEEKVRENMLELEGVQSLVVDPMAQRVTVSGFVDPLRTLKKARKVKKDSQLLSGDRLISTTKHHRSEYVRPSAYQPSSTSFVQQQYPTASTYQTSLNRVHATSSGYNHVLRPSYDEMVVANPCYFKHMEPTEYWHWEGANC